MASGALRTPLCDLLGIDVPIMQAGMGRTHGTPTPPALVIAVCEAGGLGCLGGVGLEPGELRQAIHEIRAGTSRPFAVGLLLPANLAESPPTRDEVRAAIRNRFPEHWRFLQSLHAQFGLPQVPMDHAGLLSNEHIKAQAEVVLDERVPIFVAGLGDPAWVIRDPRARDMKVIGLAGSVRNALRQRQAGVAAVIAQGYEAGGHTGTIANFALIPQVVDALNPLPVIGAGAIADGRGVAAALALGAQGAWIGTAFLFAQEADLPEIHQQQLAQARSEDLVVSRAYTGKTARQFLNETVRAWLASGLEPLPTPYQWVLMDDFVAAAEAAGRFELVNLPAGQGAGMLTERKPAHRIVDELVAGTIRELGRLAGMTRAAGAR